MRLRQSGRSCTHEPKVAHPHKRRVAFQCAVVAAVVLVAIGMSPVASGASVAGGTTVRSTAPIGDTYVGEVKNTSAFIAIVVPHSTGSAAKQKAAAYLCDGQTVKTWFFGAKAGDSTLDLVSKSGGHVHATVSSSGLTGTVDVPGSGTTSFEAVPARGVAGMYTVNHSLNHVRGFSVKRAKLDAKVTKAADNVSFSINGTVTPHGGTPVPLTVAGRFLGTGTSPATWIVLADGRATGGDDPGCPEGTCAGSGKACTVWQQIKSIFNGKNCHLNFKAVPR
jgi:hypothetical protein